MNMMNKSRIFRKWAGGISLSFLFLSTGLAPVYASDTEVYARTVDFSSDVTPVLMMVLDSSGSMLFCMDGTGPCPYPNIKRIEALQNSMRKVLYGSPSGTVVKPAPDFIKMGYARFNPDANDGGWMRYPALKLGDYVTTPASAAVTVEARVLAGADDAVSGALLSNISGTSVQLGSDVVGVRFDDLQIPRSATISGATLTFFRPNTTGSVPNKLLVKREHSANPAAYSTTNGPEALSRTYGPGLQLVTVTPANNSWIQGTVALDVTAQVQNQVDLTDWCGGQALAFKLEKVPSGSASFAAAAFEDYDRTASESDVRPRLTVTYTITGSARAGTCIKAPVDVVQGVASTLDDVEWPEGAGTAISYRDATLQPGAIRDSARNHVGLWFKKLPVPNGAAIDKAWLYVTQAQSATSVAATVEVSAYAADNIASVCSQDATTKRVTCTAPTAGLTSVATMPLAASATDLTHLAVDVTQQVREVVSRTGWAKDNAIAFHLVNAASSGAGSETSLYSVDAGLSKAAVLHVVMRPTFTNMDTLIKTARQDLFDDIKVRMYAEGGTPLADAYAEAARYLLGMASYARNTFTTTFSGQAPSQTYTQPDSRTTTTTTSQVYQSPIVDTGECSANYIFMMTDGDPNNASNVNNNSGGITGDKTTDPVGHPNGYNLDCSAYSKLPISQGNANTNFSCMISVATHLASANNQKQALIRTNTVLFDNDASTGSAVVHDMALVAAKTAGKGEFFHAKNENQLTDALLSTMTKTLDETGSITAPGVAVNQFNRLTHLDQLYYAVFDPDTGRSRWMGNVKRYRLNFSTTGASIAGRDGFPAIDSSTTFFSTSAKSFWGTDTDGNNALMGGVAKKLPNAGTRTIYTRIDPYVSGEMALTPLLGVSGATGRPLVDGLTVDEQFVNLNKWLHGYAIQIADDPLATTKIVKKAVTTISSTTATRRELGGVLHSQPVLVNFGYSGTDPLAAQTNPYLQENMLFFSTMEGMLHAVKAGGDPYDANQNGGVEQFAFMPKETLKRAGVFALGNEQLLPEFGLDVTWTVHRVDGNADLKITGSGNSGDPDKVWLYGGMRMGGSNYYALNVTMPSAPKLKWVIEGGTGSGSFGGMGQTWSKPVIGQVKVGSTIKTALFFGGGYDDKHETAGYGAANTSDAKGNQVYIVDADTGGLLWSASATGSPSMTVPDMKFSIPSELKLFDANKDGLVDAVYFGDLGGQVFRLDINNEATSNSQIGARVQRIANLGQLVTADTTNQRRFYEAPGVAMLYDSVRKAPYVAVALGSGYRGHPLDLQTEDGFYVLRDNDVLRSDLLTMTSSNLQATITPTGLAMVDLSSPAGAAMTDKMGWMIDLPASGEKVLASPLILFGEVFFTTYIPLPSTAPTQKCKPVIGASSLWRVSVTDGAASFDFNKDGTVTAEERNMAGIVQGLGGAPQLLIGEDGKNAVITGTGVERNKDLQSPTMRRTRWFEKTK